MPISAPVNAAFSMTKLLSNAIQVAKPRVMATDIKISKFFGVCQDFVVMLSISIQKHAQYSSKVVNEFALWTAFCKK
jgi:hypothetical protein